MITRQAVRGWLTDSVDTVDIITVWMGPNQGLGRFPAASHSSSLQAQREMLNMDDSGETLRLSEALARRLMRPGSRAAMQTLQVADLKAQRDTQFQLGSAARAGMPRSSASSPSSSGASMAAAATPRARCGLS